MVVQADKGVPYERITELGKIAGRAGIREMLLETRPMPLQ
jgi:biopolymer transport protein ExbD